MNSKITADSLEMVESLDVLSTFINMIMDSKVFGEGFLHAVQELSLGTLLCLWHTSMLKKG